MTAFTNISILLSYVALCHAAWFFMEKWSASALDEVFNNMIPR